MSSAIENYNQMRFLDKLVTAPSYLIGQAAGHFCAAAHDFRVAATVVYRRIRNLPPTSLDWHYKTAKTDDVNEKAVSTSAAAILAGFSYGVYGLAKAKTAAEATFACALLQGVGVAFIAGVAVDVLTGCKSFKAGFEEAYGTPTRSDQSQTRPGQLAQHSKL